MASPEYPTDGASQELTDDVRIDSVDESLSDPAATREAIAELPNIDASNTAAPALTVDVDVTEGTLLALEPTMPFPQGETADGSTGLAEDAPSDAMGAPPAHEPNVRESRSPTTVGTRDADNSLNSGKRILREFMRKRGITVLFDDSLRHNVLVQEDLGTRIRKTTITRQFLEDEFCLSPDSLGMKASEIKRIIRRVIDEEQRNRVGDLAERLFTPLSEREQGVANESWLQLAAVFEQDPELTVAKLKHFMWQVKRKTSKCSVSRHMMLIVVGAKQGTGKTQFVDRLVSPWEEAATGPVLISDIADARSADIFRFPIAKIDDMEKVQRDKIAVLKSVITGTNLRRRMLGTMDSTGFVQALTLVGTANYDIQELVDDDSGHRRFASLTMREYAGSPDTNPYWRIINDIDFPLLWRSVPVDDVAPIEGFLGQLEDEQKSGAIKTNLLAWVRGLDINAPEVCEIENRNGIGASSLYELFVSQTGSLMSQTEFGLRMRRYAGRADVPFGIKRKTSENNIYPFKAGLKRS